MRFVPEMRLSLALEGKHRSAESQRRIIVFVVVFVVEDKKWVASAAAPSLSSLAIGAANGAGR